jgi:hypothetical protein
VAKREKKAFRTDRFNLMIEPRLKKDIQGYARRKHKSVTSIVTEQFLYLLEKEKAIDVEQI